MEDFKWWQEFWKFLLRKFRKKKSQIIKWVAFIDTLRAITPIKQEISPALRISEYRNPTHTVLLLSRSHFHSSLAGLLLRKGSHHYCAICKQTANLFTNVSPLWVLTKKAMSSLRITKQRLDQWEDEQVGRLVELPCSGTLRKPLIVFLVRTLGKPVTMHTSPCVLILGWIQRVITSCWGQACGGGVLSKVVWPLQKGWPHFPGKYFQASGSGLPVEFRSVKLSPATLKFFCFWTIHRL